MAATGRHRRQQPSRINRASLTLTAGGAGMALPLIGAGTAQAASVDVWEKVAACESTNNWKINTGNGYYGGLQFTQSTWDAHGGREYAPRADLASKDQQIAIAERVLKGQGPGAWPSCSVRSGLTRGGDAPNITPDGRQSTQGAAAQGERKATASGSGQRTATPQGNKLQKQSTPPKATPTTVPTHREGYTVARGDSLSRIAVQKDIQGGWPRLYEMNRATVGSDPDLIIPGQRLVIRMAAPKTEGKPASPGTTPRQQTPKPEAAPEKKLQKKAEKPKSAPKTEKTEQAAKPRQVEKKVTKPSTKPVRAAETRTKPAASTNRSADRPTQKAGMSAPVDASTGTPYRKAGTAWSSGYHTGVDFPVPTGTSVKSVAPGRVISAGWAGSYGYQVVIRHTDGKYSQYAHLSALTVRSGQQVASGQRIGRSGSTGNSSGPHLHFEVRTGPGYGADIDPVAYLRSGGVTL
ncbi:transglycosylase family protein [Streptomyces sp. NPDC048057]|uniref:transglycosylase family protein n=1 Tax=Streptomyces sp. NPDC048057 TaxID=3155628 RepID=UPI003406073D